MRWWICGSVCGALVTLVGCQLLAGFSSEAAADQRVDVGDAAIADDADLGHEDGSDGTLPGAHVWSSGLGHAGGVNNVAVAVDGSGNTYVAGSFKGTVDLAGGPLTSAGWYDVFVASYDAGGVHRWSMRFGGALNESAKGIAVGAEGAIYVAGAFSGTINLGGGDLGPAGHGVFLGSYGPAGAPRWARRFGHTADDWANDVATDGALVVLAGNLSEHVDFGGGPIPGAQTGFVAAFRR